MSKGKSASASAHEEALKEQERQSIKAAVAGVVSQLRAEGTQLQAQLQEKAQDMQNYAVSTYANNIAGALEGQAADAATGYLSQIFPPDLNSPIK